MGEDKYTRSGIPYKLGNTPTPSTEQINTARNIFALHGVEAI
jgi:hypothetical protein